MTSALVIIDVQCGLFDDAPRPADADAVIGRINALAARARTAGVPVIWVQHERASGAPAFGSLPESICRISTTISTSTKRPQPYQ